MVLIHTLKILIKKTAYGRSNYEIAALMNTLLYHHSPWINYPKQTNGDTLIHTSVRLGILDDVQKVTEGNVVDVNTKNFSHETLLHLACALGYKHIVHMLYCLMVLTCTQETATTMLLSTEQHPKDMRIF